MSLIPKAINTTIAKIFIQWQFEHAYIKICLPPYQEHFLYNIDRDIYRLQRGSNIHQQA